MKKKVKTKSAPQPMHVDSEEEEEQNEQQDVQSVESTKLNGNSNKQTESNAASDAAENEDDNGSDDDDEDDEMDLANFKVNAKTDKTQKKRKKGIIYISNIPKHMNVTRLREILGECGKIGRVYLQPEKKLGKWNYSDKSIITNPYTLVFFRRRQGKEE